MKLAILLLTQVTTLPSLMMRPPKGLTLAYLSSLLDLHSLSLLIRKSRARRLNGDLT